MLWRERYRCAAAALLAGGAILAILDFASRDSAERPQSSLFLALAMALSSAFAGFTNWNELNRAWRFIPPIVFLAAIVASLFWAGSAATPNANIGLLAAAVMILAYVGFVSSPGSALIFSPAVMGVLFLANRLEEFWVDLALPLLGVPVAAVIGEVISFLVDRSLRTANRFTSRSDDWPD